MAACDILALSSDTPGCKTMDHLYGNGRKFTLFLLTGPAMVIELSHTNYHKC